MQLRPGSDAELNRHMPKLTDELSAAKERRLNQFGAAENANLDIGPAGDSYGAPVKCPT